MEQCTEIGSVRITVLSHAKAGLYEVLFQIQSNETVKFTAT